MPEKHASARAPLRVLQIGGLAGPGAVAGGVWAVARMQSAALVRRGAAVELVGGWLGALPATRPEPHERIFPVRRPFRGARLRGLIGVGLVKHVWDRSRRVDVVQLHLCRDFITTSSALMLRSAAIPVIAQAHGMLAAPSSRGLRMFDSLIFRRAMQTPKLWLTLTEAEEKNLESLGVPRTMMRRVVNATADPGTAWEDPQTSTFLFVSRLAPRKQPTVFVEAAIAFLREGKEARFVVAGPDQGELAAVRSLIDASGFQDRFDLPGELTEPEVLGALSRATAVVLPARHEPYPMVIIQAAAVGTPIILTSECGLASPLRKAAAAIIAEPTPEAFHAAMAAVAADQDLRYRLSARARELHLGLWSAESLAESLLGLYEEAINAVRD
ncbi:glycosyltransferase [Arthrobacter sp. ES3-54]|uniref:glycosyltransferase n=1 Tax=Arthrobacter sp. ES3-54 TaxID=1502991 RepID=UPI002404D935|nr:glycosyltransferase [Arthrobacter sp. ES3-54]MDF9752050.1 glycosyltransferase involved in cell wall biosynthesis [Arthrobacter sp. ES3-54]